MPASAPNTVIEALPARPRRRGSDSALRNLVREEQKRAFLRMVSHELRTPLNSIIGFSEIIARELYGPLNEPKYREHAEIIRDSGLRLLKLVNQVVEIARLEGDAADLSLNAESVDAAIEQALKSIREELDAHGTPVEIDSPEGLAVRADGRALNTALVNLLQNACAFSPPGAPITVRVRCRDASVSIDVEDQGDGVPTADLARILRPFEQGGNVLTRSNEGAGLGLPIARLLCKAMKGGLRLRRSAKGGLVATITLPAASPEPA
jgi:signal transduction histidine kinase